jgi:hypothetical protein
MKRKRRTKVEMAAARAASEGVGFRDIFDVLEEAPKPKKRTATKPKKRSRKSKVKVEEEKYDLPKNNIVYLDCPVKTGEKIVSKYPIPKPLPKFDGEIYDTIEFSGGAIYAKAKGAIKNAGFHIMYWNSIDKSWKMLYNGLYQKPEEQNRHWASFIRCRDELEKEKSKNGKGVGRDGSGRKKRNSSKRNARTVEKRKAAC